MEIYEEKWKVNLSECDMFGCWRPSAIMTAMQETASRHSEVLGVGLTEMTERGIAWVLSRGSVQMEKMPKTGEHILIRTYPLTAKHLFWPRVHIFFSNDGEEIGRAYCLWVVMDTRTRRIVKSPYVEEHMPKNKHMKSGMGLPVTVHPLENESTETWVHPQFTEVDCLGHVNNTKYLDWCYNAIGYDVLKDLFIAGFDINYDAETLLSDKLLTRLCIEEDRFSFVGWDEDKQHFAISGFLKPRSMQGES